MNKELKISYNILKQIYFNNAYSSIELNKYSAVEDINFGLVTKIVYGVISNDEKYNYYLNQFFKKAPKKQVTLILKIACFVKFEINSIPDFALTNELVNLAKSCELKPYSGFINAVIKNILKTDFKLDDKLDNVTRLSVTYSKPVWFIEFLINSYGLEDAVKILSANLTDSTHIRINTNLITVENFIKILEQNNVEYSMSVLNDALYVNYEKLIKLPKLNKYYTPQGITSMLVSRQCIGKNILDACSAPGGKAVYIATLNPNSTVFACDVHPHRVELINSYANRMEINNVKTCVIDATKFNPEFNNKFDVVLLDVPCSGLGVINKKPDILLKKPTNLTELQNLQLKILKNNAQYVKVGGEIVYSTCTINPGENQDVLNKFLNDNKNFSVVPVECFSIDAVGNNFKTFLPHISKTEGFFIGRIKRND